MICRSRRWYVLAVGVFAAAACVLPEPAGATVATVATVATGATGARGATGSATGAAVPTAELSIDSAAAPLSVTLVANSTGFPSPVVSYVWAFGDGKSAKTSKPMVVHRYPAPDGFEPEVTETDAAGDVATAKGTLKLFTCPPAQTCSEKLTNVSGVKLLEPTGPIKAGAAAGVDLFVGPYQIKNCDHGVGIDGAFTDSGFSGNLTVKVVYVTQRPKDVATTCFSSKVPFVNARQQTVHNGPLPMCSAVNSVPPCVESISTMQTGSGLQATKVLLVPPGDPKVGAL